MKKIVFLFIVVLILCAGCEIDSLHEHKFSSEWTSNASYHWHAATCGHDEVSAKAAHIWDSGKVTVMPTETVQGSYIYTCTVCGATKTVVPKTIQFETNCDIVIDDIIVGDGEYISAPDVPKREGYKFEGWYSDSNFKYRYGFISAIRSNTKLYAKWIVDGPCVVKWAGVRVSGYGMRSFGKNNFPDEERMVGFAEKMSGWYEGSTGAYVLIVGTLSGNRCNLTFPIDGEYESIRGNNTDTYESYLDAFDEAGYSVWLQVEPGYADLETLAELVMDRYSHHSCVKGFGIDVEWHKPVEGSDEGTKLSDADAKKVLDKVRSYDPEYTVFVKHWMQSHLPSNMEGIIYVNDSQQFDSMDHVLSEFTDWASYYAPQPVMFQIGYRADEWIWGEYANPAREFGEAIMEECNSGNDVGIIWVDFTLSQVIDIEDPE